MLSVWLPLNGNLDNQGLMGNLSFINENTTINTNGKIGSCYSFNGTNTCRMYCGTAQGHNKQVWSGKPISFALWFKYNGSTTSGVLIEIAADLCLNYKKNDSGIQFGYWRCYTNTSGNRAGDSAHYATYYDINSWHHIAIVFEGPYNRLYVDGNLSYTWDSSSKYTENWIPLLYSGYDKIAIGVTYGGTNPISGLVNDVRIYDHALSPLEVKHLAQGLVLHYPLNRGGFGKDNICKNRDIYLSGSDYGAYSTRSYDNEAHIGKIQVTDTNHRWNAWKFGATDLDTTCVELTTGVNTYTMSVDIKVTNYTTGTIICGFDFRTDNTVPKRANAMLTKEQCDGSWHRISATLTTNDEKTNQCLWSINSYGTVHGSQTTIEYKNWKLERGDIPTPWTPNPVDDLYSQMGLDNNIEYDVSGYGNNGTKHGITYDSDTPRYQVSAVLDGTSYIKIDTNEWMVHGAKALTWSIWAYSDDWTAETDGGRLVSCTESGGFNIEGGASGYLRVPFYVFKDSEGSSKGYVYYNSSIQLASLTPGWHLFTTTYSTEAIKTYVDGVLTYSYSYTSYGIGFNKNARLYLGCEANTANPSGPYFNGKLSDFRLYYTALSAEDVYNLYAVGASLSNTGVLFSNEVSEV